MKRYTPALILASLALLGSFLPSLSFAATILDTTSAFGSGNNIHYSGYTNGIAWGAVYLGTLSSNLLSTDTLHIDFTGASGNYIDNGDIGYGCSLYMTNGYGGGGGGSTFWNANGDNTFSGISAPAGTQLFGECDYGAYGSYWATATQFESSVNDNGSSCTNVDGILWADVGSDIATRAGHASPICSITAQSPAVLVYANTVTPPGAAISFYTPTNGTTTPDFPAWQLAITNPSTTIPLSRFDVVYFQAGGSATYDDFNVSYIPEAGYLNIPKTRSLDTGGTSGWYAQGFLFATSTTADNLASMHPELAIASTSLIYFNVNANATGTEGGAIFPGAPSSTAGCGTSTPFFQFTGSAPFFQINDPIPSIGIGVCNAGNWLFTMNATDAANVAVVFNHAKSIISSKPPFGYFTIVVSDLTNLQKGSTTIILLNSAAATSFSPIFNPLDIGLSSAVGLLSLFWVLRRMKHIQP